MRHQFIVMVSLFFFCGCSQGSAMEKHRKTTQLMGCRFEITALHENAQTAWDGINAGIAEIERIERLISSWDKNSQTSEINRNAGIRPVKVDAELLELIERSVRVSKLTDGAFDITFASAERIWKFDGTEAQTPDKETIQASVEKINYENIIIDKKVGTVFLSETGMRIGFGGIGKGYAAQKAKEVMKNIGIENGVVNASGDLIAWGLDQEGQKWPISIADPKNIDSAIAEFDIGENAVVTSGDYEKYLLIDGIRHAHIIHPKTGYPTTGIKSATVICPNPELGDALATAIFVLGLEKGIGLINQLKGIECIVITDKDEIITSNEVSTRP